MVAWPSKFKILREGFSETPADRVISSQMDVGPAKKRRRTILGVKNISFMVQTTIADYADFEQFYLDNDVGSFDFTHPRTNQTVKARFVSVPTGELEETVYRIPVQLEILP